MDWKPGWRERAWSQLGGEWDIVIVGGGVTGAGILRQAAHAGLRAVLFEAHDFASGTSSRSSKLVHGGMRYLKNAQFKMTYESVSEREYLLKQGRGLVNRLGFLYTALRGDKMPGFVFGLGLTLYDLMAGQWTHRSYDELDLRELCPPLSTPDLRGGYRYFDAQTDDARLVLRLLRESVSDGALALNYARVESLLRTADGRVRGVVVSDRESGRSLEAQARVVINATGAWADNLRKEVGRRPRIRPLRGSHLVLPFARLPLTRAVSFLHPKDGRPVFALPWEGAVIFGTTDVDHTSALQTDPSISGEEFEYLLSALRRVFPASELTPADVIATFSGLRPVVDTGKADPSRESREHAIWDENGLLTVSGGKLTTFRLMARDALKAARKYLGRVHFDAEAPILDPLPPEAEALLAGESFNPAMRLRLLGRYGAASAEIFKDAPALERQVIPSTPYLWAELRQAARDEGAAHLDDLLLRRLRLGLLLPEGGRGLLPRIRAILQPELGWDDRRWEREAAAYLALWKQAYRL
ncbi:MAG: glycerol-3-phosphate dehydrogenase/oxidase [Chloroflexota bacterium]